MDNRPDADVRTLCVWNSLAIIHAGHSAGTTRLFTCVFFVMSD